MQPNIEAPSLAPIAVSVQGDQAATVRAIIEKGKRKKGLQIHNHFVQQPEGGKKKQPGILHKLVASGNERALDLFLLHRLLAVKEPWEASLENKVWARALGISGSSSTSTISRLFRRLTDMDLMDKSKNGRTPVYRALHDSGNGSSYEKTSDYLTIPLEYWTEDIWLTLGLPAKAVLLIFLSLPAQSYLPQNQVSKWYGISADTLGKGVKQLKELGFLEISVKQEDDFLVASKFRTQHYYTLKSPFQQMKGKRN